MTTTETILRNSLELIWQIRRERQEAAREQAIRDAMKLEDDRARWSGYGPEIVQRNDARVTEHGELQ